MPKLIALLLALSMAAFPVAACSSDEEPQTAAEFCAEHGGVQPDSEEPDGDATCEDGTQFEADADESSSSSSKKKKKKSSSSSSGSSSSKSSRRR